MTISVISSVILENFEACRETLRGATATFAFSKKKMTATLAAVC